MTPPDEAPATAGNVFQLNLDSPLVHRHVCAAALDLAQVNLESKRRAGADWARQLALDDRCEMQAFAELWNRFGRP